jgi:Fe-S oxidoreductase
MPQGHVCCGRPLYDYGFLDAAQHYLHRVLDELRDYVRADVPVVGMEPSCLAVFKDELTRMMPHDDDARRLVANSYHFAEFFRTFGITPPQMAGQVLLWGHCHQRATGGTGADRELLEQMGLSVRDLQGGCCGLAGSWGFEDGKYRISMDCGEQALLPAIRDADPATTVVANGFSCSTQIADAGVGQRAIHAAQVMRRARSGSGQAPRKPAPPLARRAARTGSALAAAASVLAVTAWSGARLVRTLSGRR